MEDIDPRGEPGATRSGRTVWRASRRSLLIVGAFAVVVGLGPLAVGLALLIRHEAWPVVAVLVVVGLGALAYAWRFGFHPRLVAGDALVVANPGRTHRIGWEHLTAARPGGDGLVLERTDGPPVQAWCVQTSNRSVRRGGDRAEGIAAVVLERAQAARVAVSPVTVRPATDDEAAGLTEIERLANLIALRHVFGDLPYPTAAVQQRWQQLLGDEDVEVVVAEREGDAIGVIAYDDGRIRHLAVRPEHGGTGVGSRLLEAATEDLFDDPFCRRIRLRVLTENHRARRFYAGHGWDDTDERSTAEFPPHPEEREMIKTNPRAARRAR